MINTEKGAYLSDNILKQEELVKKIEILKNEGKKIGFCSGSFDLLHPGHINHLIAAKKECDVLVVAIASDSHNIKTRKQKGRAIFNHDLRAFAIAQLKSVDFVLINENAREVINLLKPNVYIKGIDHINLSNPILVLEKKAMEFHGGSLVFTSTERLGTTELIKYIKEEVE